MSAPALDRPYKLTPPTTLWGRLTKYFGLWTVFFRSSLIADLEFRMNFVVRIVTDIFWYIAQIFTFEVLYRHTERIGDWNLEQTRVFLGMLFVVDAIYMVIIHDNFDKFSDRVRKGELDLILAKPVNSQFMVSLQRSATAILGNLVIGVGWLTFSLWNLESFEWPRLLWLLILVPSGVTVFYAFRFFFASSAVIFTKSESVQFIWYQLYKLGMRPDSIYAPWIKYFLLSLFPVAIIASVPARALIDPANPWLFAWSVFMASLALWFTTRFWKFALRFYSSASS